MNEVLLRRLPDSFSVIGAFCTVMVPSREPELAGKTVESDTFKGLGTGFWILPVVAELAELKGEIEYLIAASYCRCYQHYYYLKDW
jgi:hypothetical protein